MVNVYNLQIYADNYAFFKPIDNVMSMTKLRCKVNQNKLHNDQHLQSIIIMPSQYNNNNVNIDFEAIVLF